MRVFFDRQALRFALAALVVAPAALYLYTFSEWLFLVTGASPLAALPLGARLRAFLEAPLPMLGWLLWAQIIASFLSTVHPKARPLAVLPSAAILGLLGLMLFDNFTYTVFSLGIIRTGSTTRVAYAAGLLILIAVATIRLEPWITRVASWRVSILGVLAVGSLVLGATSALGRPTEQKETSGAGWISTNKSLPGASDSRRPNVLLLGSDGMDAHFLSVYGYRRPTTPFLERLRGESLFFENAFSNVGSSRGSMVTLLTGRLPTRTKVSFPPTAVHAGESYWHLPGILKKSGYSTLQLGLRHQADAEDANLLGAFDAANFRWESLVSSDSTIGSDADRLRLAVLERAESRILHCFGVRRMIDEYAFVVDRGDDPHLRDSVRVETLLRYLSEAHEPWLVHVHMTDTHCCKPKAERIFFRTGERTDFRDNVLRNADERFRVIVEALRKNGQLDRTIIVISSDHPYSWGTTGRIPLMIRFPRGEASGTVATNVQLADVAPTILDYLEMPVPPWMDGISLLGEGPRPDRPIVGVAHTDQSRRVIGTWRPVIIDAGPPNYGVTVGSLIVGSQWYKLHLKSGRMAAGRVVGHTRPGSVGIDDATAYDILVKRFASAGFRVTNARTGRVDPPVRRLAARNDVSKAAQPQAGGERPRGRAK